MVAELEAKEVSRGSMYSLRTDLPTEVAREIRKKRHSGSRGWRKRCVKHRSEKKNLEARMQDSSECKQAGIRARNQHQSICSVEKQ